MELLALESEKGDSNFYDPIQNFDFINLNFYLTKSFNEYMYHITDNDLSLARRDKNKLGVHFIIKEIIRACRSSKYKKYFYYYADSDKSIEGTLVKRIFNALSPRIIYGDVPFFEFIRGSVFNTIGLKEAPCISLAKFRGFLKRNELRHLEQQLLTDMNIKLSLMT